MQKAVVVDGALTLLNVCNCRNPFLFSDSIFYCTPTGREFSRLCDFVHKKAERIIKTRRIALQTQVLKKLDPNVSE